jgi:hypothetical protein
MLNNPLYVGGIIGYVLPLLKDRNFYQNRRKRFWIALFILTNLIFLPVQFITFGNAAVDFIVGFIAATIVVRASDKVG